MFVSGKVYKSGNKWLIEIPAMDLMTQGYTRKDAYEMICDAVKNLVDRSGVKVEIFSMSSGEFALGVDDDAAMMALILKGQRAKHGLSLADMAKRLGSSSRNAYAQYEQGRSVPSLAKLQQLLSLMDPKAIVSLNLIDEIEGRVA